MLPGIVFLILTLPDIVFSYINAAKYSFSLELSDVHI